MVDFILASASPRRVSLLETIGIIPDKIIPADINEDPFKGEQPKPHALRLAQEKAQKIAQQHPDDIILAGDTVVACGRRILPKGEKPEDAEFCLNLLSGRRHKIHSGIAIIYKGKMHSRVITTEVSMKRLTKQEISDYVKTNEWEGKAGAYGIQGKASAFVKSINGSYTNIVGLCTHNVYQMLQGIKPDIFKS